MAATKRTRAFTLVEILIVVVILGILAAIVIPQFTNASQESIKAALRGQLKQIDDQIEVYRVNHAGLIPTTDANPFGGEAGWGVLVGQNYLKTEPFNMYAGGSVVGVGTTAADAAAAEKGSAVGWFYVVSDPTRLDVYAAGYDEVANRLSNEVE